MLAVVGFAAAVALICAVGCGGDGAVVSAGACVGADGDLDSCCCCVVRRFRRKLLATFPVHGDPHAHGCGLVMSYEIRYRHPSFEFVILQLCVSCGRNYHIVVSSLIFGNCSPEVQSLAGDLVVEAS